MAVANHMDGGYNHCNMEVMAILQWFHGWGSMCNGLDPQWDFVPSTLKTLVYLEPGWTRHTCRRCIMRSSRGDVTLAQHWPWGENCTNDPWNQTARYKPDLFDLRHGVFRPDRTWWTKMWTQHLCEHQARFQLCDGALEPGIMYRHIDS